jgi:plastocyanin domain-containing protein
MPAANSRKRLRDAPVVPATLWPATVAAVTRGQESPQEISLSLGDYHFTLDSLEVQAGRPVVLTLINTDSLTPHNLTLQDTASGLNIKTDVSAGSTSIVEFTPVNFGTYTFFCNKKLLFMNSYRERDMEETLRVTPPAAD